MSFRPVLILIVIMGFFVWMTDIAQEREQKKQMETNLVVEKRSVIEHTVCSRIMKAEAFELIREKPLALPEYENQLVLEDGRHITKTSAFIEKTGSLYCEFLVTPVYSVKIP